GPTGQTKLSVNSRMSWSSWLACDDRSAPVWMYCGLVLFTSTCGIELGTNVTRASRMCVSPAYSSLYPPLWNADLSCITYALLSDLKRYPLSLRLNVVELKLRLKTSCSACAELARTVSVVFPV